LIEAFRKNIKKNKNLYLVLSGPKNNYFSYEILTQIKKNNIQDKIIITGPLKDDMKWQALSNSFALCLTSHQENFGIVIAESLSCGKPVLITDKVNTSKTIKKYKAGMVSKNNLKSISKMLSNFMLLNKKNYIEYCDNAKKCFKENYKIDKPVQNLIELIKNEI
jgi:glycosyltransferase involved in cell wall biosynthesis